MPSLREQGLRGRRVANDLDMPESVDRNIDRGAVLEKLLDLLRPGEDRHRISDKLTARLTAPERRTRWFSDTQTDSDHLWRNDCELRALLLQCMEQGLDVIALGLIRRHQRADLSSFQRRLGLTDDRERGRWF